MFTGIVEEIGTIRHVVESGSGKRVEITCARALERLAVDASVNVSGVCLTVVARDDRSFTVDIVPETLERSTLRQAIRGTRVNLERAATPETFLGGHIVQGHVDGTARLRERELVGEGARLGFALPRSLSRYVVEKGFIAVDGVSLTITKATRDGFDVALIPHTAMGTTLGALREGGLANVEVDVIGKYVERLLGPRARPR